MVTGVQTCALPIYLRQDGDDLLLAHQNEHRRIAMPDSLHGRQVTGARFLHDELVLTMT